MMTSNSLLATVGKRGSLTTAHIYMSNVLSKMCSTFKVYLFCINMCSYVLLTSCATKTLKNLQMEEKELCNVKELLYILNLKKSNHFTQKLMVTIV